MATPPPSPSSRSSSSIAPYSMASWVGSLLRSSRRPVDRALGAAATLGVSFVVLRLVGQALQAAKKQTMRTCSSRSSREDAADGDHRQASQISVKVLHDILQRLLASVQEHIRPPPSLKTVVHKGSCHCQAIRFELCASETLLAHEDPSAKIRYPHVRTRASRVRLSKEGTDRLQLYYVSAAPKHSSSTTTTTTTTASTTNTSCTRSAVAAHSFCSQCGVHILYAPSAESEEVHVNVSLLQESSRRNMRVTVRTSGREQERWSSFHGGGVPVEEQRTGPANGQGSESSFFPRFDDAVSSLDKSSPTVASPGTPSTETTTTTTTTGTSLTNRSRLFVSEQESALSEEDSDSITSTFPRTSGLRRATTQQHSVQLQQQLLHHPTDTVVPTILEPPNSPSSSATPMMRDQLKYYMSKHLPAQQWKMREMDKTRLMVEQSPPHQEDQEEVSSFTSSSRKEGRDDTVATRRNDEPYA